MPASRPVFYVSDGTGITAETIGHSLLTQFTAEEFATDRLPFVDTPDKAREAAGRIRAAGEAAGARPIVVSSCVDGDLTALLAESGALMLDVFAPFIAPLERELGRARQPRVGQAHGIVDFESYHRRINAMNYALTHDDGMALHHGVRAANYPLTEEDLEASERLPAKLRAFRSKLFGLTIDPIRLQQIRQERRPNARYSQLDTCRREVAQAEAMLRREGIEMLSTTHASIEEISSRVLEYLGINREMY